MTAAPNQSQPGIGIVRSEGEVWKEQQAAKGKAMTDSKTDAVSPNHRGSEIPIGHRTTEDDAP